MGPLRWRFGFVVLSAVLLCGPGRVRAQTGSQNLSDRLTQIRDVMYDKLDQARAETGARALLAEVESSRGTESVEAATVLDVLVEILNGGRPFYYPNRKPAAEAVDLGRRALKLKELHFGPEHPQVALSLHRLAVALWLQGADTEAKADYERALAIQEKTLAPNDPALAETHEALAAFLKRREDWGAAQAHLERALQVYEAAYGPEHQRVAGICGELGAHLRDMGEYSTAIPLFERSLAIYEKLYGPTDPDVAGSLNSLAGVYFMRGDWPEAERLLSRAIALISDPRFAIDRVIFLFNKGELLLQIGDKEGAKAVYEQGLEILRREGGESNPNVARGLAELAEVYLAQDDWETAKGLLQRAIASREKVDGPNSPQLAVDLDTYATALAKSGDRERALETWQRSLGIIDRSHAPESWRANVLDHMGRALESSDLARARDVLHNALAIREKMSPEPTPELAATLAQVAGVEARLGNRQEALPLTLRAEEVARDHLKLTLGVVAERQALSYAAARPSGLDLALSLPLDELTLPKVWDAVVRSRALVLDEMAGRHRSFADIQDPAATDVARRLASARERMANLVIRGPQGDASQYGRMLASVRREKEDAERALAAKSASFREQHEQHRAGLAEVLKAVPDAGALVAFVRFQREPLSPPSGSQAAGPQVASYAAFVLNSADRRPLLLLLGPADRIEQAVARWRHEINQEAQAAGHGARRNKATYYQAGKELRRRLWDPVAPYLRGARTVFVVPDGSLHLVNFAALPVGRGRYLLDSGREFHYLAAERDLAFPSSMTPHQGLLAVGSAAFDAPSSAVPGKPRVTAKAADGTRFRGTRSACGGFQSMRFEPLPSSARETAEIAALWRRQQGQGQMRGPAMVVDRLSGSAASEAAFKKEASGKRVIHLATHGFFLGGQCASALDKEASRNVTGENPLLLSGLALAGANQRRNAGPDEDDGILTAEEIASLDLRGVEWVVLSACDTGVGEVRAGEGVLGLRRAFQVAGVHTVIMSLWPVEDEATRQWMRRLYVARLRGQSTIQAVSTASRQSLAARRAKGESTHPFYWAGFVAAGDWR